ncbi:lipid II-degrading bacteriocin [Paracidovorax cattleyae]|uniref:Colicin M n=1 Tax=Paracidovorax cattleyae TaxID=80868 RepID=A0A1H0SEV0_9BURK|nr:lipid II-degrading bacteriocin [Paracidovorax cattleyae]SDP40254.1 Colicin M [Paracidovorax cattleyae]
MTTLGEITVTGAYEGEFTNWNACFNTIGLPGQEFAFALSYMFSEDAFWDMDRKMSHASPTDVVNMLLHACAIYDYSAAGWPKNPIEAYQVVPPNTPYTPSPYPLDGTIWSIPKVTGHWLWGNGSPVSIDIESLAINVTASRIGAGTENSFESFAAAHPNPGTYDYDSGPYGYSTYGDGNAVSALVVGGISLRTTGSFTRMEDGSFTFTGSTGAYDDIFNMDRRPGRPWWADAVVDVFNSIGGQDFTVIINGKLPTNLTGR